MGRCTKVNRSSRKLPKHEVFKVLMKNLQSFDKDILKRASEQEIEKRVKSCVSCEHLFSSSSCSLLGSCATSFTEFYKYHLLREKGRCPIGRW